jgi:hypothetical protein
MGFKINSKVDPLLAKTVSNFENLLDEQISHFISSALSTTRKLD